MIEEKNKLHALSSRLEALGDGVFGVAMTILVIDIGLPKINGDNWNDFITGLQHSANGILCYAISFIILGIMWFGHRMMFEYIGKTNRYFIFLGVLFYMIICFVPFSTQFLAKYTLKWYAITVYALNLSLCNISLYLQWSYGIKRPSLIERPLPAEVKKEARVLFLLSPVVYSIAIIFSFFIPWASIAIFILTPILYLIPNKLDKYLP